MGKPAVYVALSQFCEHSDRPRCLLADAGFEVRENREGRRLRADELPDLLADVYGVIAGVEPYDARLLASLPRLRCISRCGVGTDSIDLASAARLDIEVFKTVEEVVEPVAQMTVAMILGLARNLPQHSNDFRSDQWRKRTGSLLSEWTIGLIGFGRIGRRVEGLLRSFAPKIVVVDPDIRSKDLPEGVRICALDQLLAESDLVSLHASRRPDEGPLLGERELTQMKPGSRLVNTSRGFMVNEVVLLENLQSGRLSGAALDVFEAEPYCGPLSKLPQVICTPHVSTLTISSRVEMESKSAESLVSFLNRR